MENTGAHRENISSTEKRGACAPGAPGQSPHCPCLLVAATSEAAVQTAIRDLPPCVSRSCLRHRWMGGGAEIAELEDGLREVFS